MAFQFPANPTIGQQFAPATGTTYEWNGTGWIFLGLNTASLYPAGIILPYAGHEALPFQGWLLCDGKSYSTAAQPALFAIIQYFYGGSGANFNVPDLRGRVIAGPDNMGGTAANRLPSMPGWTSTGGAERIVLTAAELAAHAHGITDAVHSHGVSDPTHAHGVYDPGHNHSLNDPSHTHGVSDPSHTHGIQDQGHSHSSSTALGVSLAAGSGPYFFGSGDRGLQTVPELSFNGGGISAQASGTGIWINGAYTGQTANAAGTGIGIFGSGTGIGIAASGSGISGTNAAGGGQAHLNVQPTIVLNYLIKT